jgi:RNA polymerase sigma-70 factor (ECF subfamily)
VDLDQLIKQAQSGDESSFAQVFDHCYDIMYRYALKWSGDPDDAADITQQSSLKLAQNIQQFRFESAFSTWLYRLVINCAKDWQRNQRKHSSSVDDDYRESPVPELSENSGFNWILLRQILTKIHSMGEGYKEAVILVLGEGLSHFEAAQILSVKESTVSWRIHQARKFIASAEEY